MNKREFGAFGDYTFSTEGQSDLPEYNEGPCSGTGHLCFYPLPPQAYWCIEAGIKCAADHVTVYLWDYVMNDWVFVDSIETGDGNWHLLDLDLPNSPATTINLLYFRASNLSSAVEIQNGMLTYEEPDCANPIGVEDQEICGYSQHSQDSTHKYKCTNKIWNDQGYSLDCDPGGCLSPAGAENVEICGDATYGQDPTHKYKCWEGTWYDLGEYPDCIGNGEEIDYLPYIIIGAGGVLLLIALLSKGK